MVHVFILAIDVAAAGIPPSRRLWFHLGFRKPTDVLPYYGGMISIKTFAWCVS